MCSGINFRFDIVQVFSIIAQNLFRQFISNFLNIKVIAESKINGKISKLFPA